MAAKKRATWANFKRAAWSIAKEHFYMGMSVAFTWGAAHYFVETSGGIWPSKSSWVFVLDNIEKAGGVAGVLSLFSIIQNWLRSRK